MACRIDILVPPDASPPRLDIFLAQSDLSLSRSHIQNLIEDGRVTVNDRPTRPSCRVKSGDRIVLFVPDPEPSGLLPEALPLDILFEDEHLLVVNKSAGMAVHPAAGVRSGTLVNALLHRCDGLSGINGVMRPGIVHRLDRDTSGLLVVAKHDATHRGLAAQLQARTAERLYVAFVWGHFDEDAGRIEASIGRHPGDRKRMSVIDPSTVLRTGRNARAAATRFWVEGRFDFLSRLAVQLETGRTHQIRVHLSHVGRPVFGDPTYGGREKRLSGIAPEFREGARRLLGLIPRQALHAQTLGFIHPITGEHLRFTSELPDDVRALEKALEEGR